MELTLIRHGETEWNRLQKCQGASDIPLNRNGREQAKKLAASLKSEKFDAIFSSGLKRAKQTAREIAKYHRLKVAVRKNFAEMDQGDFEGIEFSELRKNRADVLKMWTDDPENFRIPGGESLMEVQRRAMREIVKLQKNRANSRVAVVSHNLTIVSLLCKFSGSPICDFRSFKIGQASKTVVLCEGVKYTVRLLNDTSHLECETQN